MAIRKKGNPYQELGEYIKEKRFAKYRFANALYKEAKFSFSYSTYVDFEKGAILPSVENLIEISRFLQINVFDIVLLWAQVQMPINELKDLFKYRRRPREKDPQKNIGKDGLTFENTWVFNSMDREILIKAPWLWNVCVHLSLNFPKFVPVEDITRPDDISAVDLVNKYLYEWIKAGHIINKGNKLCLKLPHNYLPKTDEWKEVRDNNVRNINEELIESITTKKLKNNEL